MVAEILGAGLDGTAFENEGVSRQHGDGAHGIARGKRVVEPCDGGREGD